MAKRSAGESPKASAGPGPLSSPLCVGGPVAHGLLTPAFWPFPSRGSPSQAASSPGRFSPWFPGQAPSPQPGAWSPSPPGRGVRPRAAGSREQQRQPRHGPFCRGHRGPRSLGVPGGLREVVPSPTQICFPGKKIKACLSRRCGVPGVPLTYCTLRGGTSVAQGAPPVTASSQRS